MIKIQLYGCIGLSFRTNNNANYDFVIIYISINEVHTKLMTKWYYYSFDIPMNERYANFPQNKRKRAKKTPLSNSEI